MVLAGKWVQSDWPHMGWEIAEVKDEGSAVTLCEMCEAKLVRYVHKMKHSSIPDQLRVGCVCAGKMIGNPGLAKYFEARTRSYSGKRARWLKRKGWNRNMKGDLSLAVGGDRLMIFKQCGRYKFVYRTHWSSEDWATLKEAQLAAFDWLVDEGWL